MKNKKDENINKKSLKAAIMYIFNNFLIKGISVITVPIFSRMLSTEEYGTISNFQSWSSILTIIISLDLYSSIQRAKLDYEEKLDEYLSSILGLSSIVIIIIAILSNLFSEFVTNILSMNTFMINYLYLYIFFDCALMFYQTKCRVTLRYKTATAISIITSILSVCCSFLFMAIMKDLAFARILGITIPTLIIAIFLYIKTFILGKKFINKEYWKYGLALSIPLIPHHLSGNILSHCDKIIITKFCNYEKTALYSMAYNITSLLSLLWSSFNGAWTPWFFEKMKKEMYNEINKVSKYYFLIFWLISIMILAISPEIMKIMAPNAYYESIYVIPPVVIGIIFQFVYSLYVNVEFYYKKNKYIPIGTIASAIINTVLNIVLIPKYGYISASYTTLIGYVSLLIFHYFMSKKICGNITFFNSKYLLIMLIISILLGGMYLELYSKGWYYRYIVSAIILVVIIFKEKDNIIKSIKSIKNRSKQI